MYHKKIVKNLKLLQQNSKLYTGIWHATKHINNFFSNIPKCYLIYHCYRIGKVKNLVKNRIVTADYEIVF